jgi:hypothetical protein
MNERLSETTVMVEKRKACFCFFLAQAAKQILMSHFLLAPRFPQIRPEVKADTATVIGKQARDILSHEDLATFMRLMPWAVEYRCGYLGNLYSRTAND